MRAELPRVLLSSRLARTAKPRDNLSGVWNFALSFDRSESRVTRWIFILRAMRRILRCEAE